MKKTICLVLAFIVILIIACNNPKKAVIENPYVGAWENTNITYIVHFLNGRKLDSTIVVPAKLPYIVKLVTKKHYAQGSQTVKDEIVAGGGEYTYSGDSVTNIRSYSSVKGQIGKPVTRKSKIEGDLWKLSITVKNDTIQYDRIETWRRIPE
jgi:hypothetical protein